MSWKLRLLGGASLEAPGKRVEPERKTAALLAYLALEGGTGRSRLAGLLWPDSGEERARANLRQLLRRLRNAVASDLLEDSGSTLALTPGVTVDLHELTERPASADAGLQAAAWTGELLAGHDYDDCPQLFEWLAAQRSRLVELRCVLLDEAIERCRAEGDLAGAVKLAHRRLSLDRLAEETWRLLMRLHYLAGDRAAALRAFAQCRAELARELGVDPVPETLELAREIEMAWAPSEGRAEKKRLPLAFERPPRLVGREREWQAMAAAWARGLPVVLRGETGAGKSRLLGDFAASRGKFARLAAQPGDANVPYALFSRWLRDLPDDVRASVPGWARRELARIVPEIEPAAAPAAGEPGEPRLLPALSLAVQSWAGTGTAALLVDDLHFADSASVAALAYLVPDTAPAGKLRWLFAHEAGALGADAQRLTSGLTAAGALLLDLGPLDPSEVRELLATMPLPGHLDIAGPLHRHTGGNPLYLVETLRSLAESDRLAAPLPEQLGVPSRIGAILSRRLARLSPEALTLARVAAVLDDAFDLTALGDILGVRPLELAPALAELHEAQLTGEDGFAHELMRQAVLDGMSAPARRHLHGLVAGYLEGLPVPPALVAHHHLQSGNDGKAAPFLAEAGDAAVAAYRFDEGAVFYRQAAALLEEQGDRSGAFEVLLRAVDICLKNEYGPEHEELEKALFRLASNPGQLARAWQTRALFLQALARLRESEAAAREGHRHAVAAGDTGLECELLNNVVGALWLQDRLDETIVLLERVLELASVSGDPDRLSEGLANMGVILDHLDRHREALDYHERAVELRNRHGGRLGQVQLMGNLAVCQAELGRMLDSLATAERMLLLLGDIEGASDLQVHALLAAGTACRDLGRLQAASDYLAQALELAEGLGTWLVNPVRRHVALLEALLGRAERAQELLEAAVARPEAPSQYRLAELLALAGVRTALGKDAREQVTQAAALAGDSPRPLRKVQLLLAEAAHLPAAAALQAAREASAVAATAELFGLQVVAETRCAQAALDLGEVAAAVRHTRISAELLQEYDPLDFDRNEVAFTRYRALAAAGEQEAADVLEGCLESVLATAASLPDGRARQEYLTGNPVSREIVRTASALGLSRAASAAP